MPRTHLSSIATATPEHARPQSEALAFMQQIESLPEPLRRRLPAVYQRTGIERRHSCVPDYMHDDPAQFEFFPQNLRLEPAPTSAERNQWYRHHAVPLAEKVARDALDQADVGADEITHVVTVSCTGFFAPGIDIELVRRLGLDPSTQRTHVGFMGCYAAFNALRVADGFCRSQPGARVLVVCVELCTLHFQIDDTLERAVVNALFADGAAAAVLSSVEEERPGWYLRRQRTALHEDSMDHMTWDLGDTGFDMTLSPRVPHVIAEVLPDYIEELGEQQGADRWAIHPGGPAIVEKAAQVLDLEQEDVEESLGVLRDYGNMSSPTILFVLDRVLQGEAAPGERCIALAFGPGLTIEGALFERR